MAKSLDEIYDWFRAEAEKLSPDVRIRVINALRHTKPSQVFLDLERLREEGKLASPWEPELTAFFEAYCY